MTDLTAEARELLDLVAPEQGPDVTVDAWRDGITARLRAIEGSGVRALRMLVESAVLVSLEADEDPFDAWVVSPDALDYARSTLADLRESC